MQRSTFEIRRAFRSAFRSGIFTRRRLYDTFEFCNSVWETVTVARIGNSHGTRAMYTIIHRWLNIATPRVTNPTELETVKAPTRSLVALPCIRTGELCPGYHAYSYIFAASYFFSIGYLQKREKKNLHRDWKRWTANVRTILARVFSDHRAISIVATCICIYACVYTRV